MWYDGLRIRLYEAAELALPRSSGARLNEVMSMAEARCTRLSAAVAAAAAARVVANAD